MMSTPTRSRRRRRRGATLVESAFTLNIFFLLMFGTFEFGRLMMIRHLLDNAARGAARQAASGTYDVATTTIQQTATNLLVGQPFATGPTVQVFKADIDGNNIGAWTDAKFGERIAVQIDVTYKPMVPTLGIVSSTVPLRSKAIMRSEGD